MESQQHYKAWKVTASVLVTELIAQTDLRETAGVYTLLIEQPGAHQSGFNTLSSELL